MQSLVILRYVIIELCNRDNYCKIRLSVNFTCVYQKIMNISKISVKSNNQPMFRRAFSSEERIDAEKIRSEALKLLDCSRIILIVPETSLPSPPGKDTGVGKLNSKYNDKLYDFLKTYTGVTSLKILPQGEYVKSSKNFYCNYRTSALTLGTHTINLEELTSKDMDNILSNETLNNVYNKGGFSNQTGIANFENVVGNGSNQDKALYEAYVNFVKSKNLDAEKQLFERFKKENCDVIEKRALFEVLSDEYNTKNSYKYWNNIDKNLFNPDIVSERDKTNRIKELKEKYPEKIDFVFFKQYLAEKHLSKGREQLHKKGLTLTGDCLIGFTTDELWAYPKAFEKANICSKEWGLIALNFADVATDGSESNKLLKLKFEKAAKHYDNIRVDVGWAYINPIIYPKDENKHLLEGRYVFDGNVNGYRVKNPLGDKVLNIIEDTVKRVKGNDYKKENIFYETEAGSADFSAYDWCNNKVIDPLKDRTIIQSTLYMDNEFATVEQLENKMKISRDNYIIMTGNHDHLSLYNLANENDTDGLISRYGNDVKKIKNDQLEVLSKKFNIKEKILAKPEEFIKAKFAYNFLGKNLKMFFMDVFGRKEQFDSQIRNSSVNYRYRISSRYEDEFHKAVQEQRGLNIYDAIAKAMKAKGLDKTNKDLYKKIIKYRNILYKKGSLTEDKANKIKTRNRYVKTALIAAGVLLSSLGLSLAYAKYNSRVEFNHDFPTR